MKRGKLVKDEVPFLPDKHIEEEANLLLAEYGQSHGEIVAPPVPIGEILEVRLHLEFEIDDLRGRFKTDDVLGAIYFETRTVRVDTRREPYFNPSVLARQPYWRRDAAQ